MTALPAAPLKALREPFPDAKVGKRPVSSCKACSDAPRGQACAKHKMARCKQCGNWLTTAHTHLDFVGHAHVTGRLLDVDPQWSWEPLAFDQQGLPAFDANGGLWIKLTVAGVTRLGYGDAQGKKGPNAVKEVIGDCLLRGTPVRTQRGTVPIEEVTIRDVVPTRDGWRQVTDHWMSHSEAPTVAVLLGDGRVLVGTPHHLVPTAQRGAQRIAALRNGDMLYAWLGTGANRGQPRSAGVDADTDACQTIPTDTAASITWPLLHPGVTSTKTSTKPLTGPSLMDGTSTMSTTTLLTTGLRISPSSRLKRTPNCMAENSWDASKPAMSAASRIPPCGSEPAGAQLPAKSADVGVKELPTSARALNERASVDDAKSAAQTTKPENPGRNSALVPVVAVLDAGPGEVWNLSVGDVHEYVANGLIVHNSIRNAAMRFGVALDLWSKERDDYIEQAGKPTARQDQSDPRQALWKDIESRGVAAGMTEQEIRDDFAGWTGPTNKTIDGADTTAADLTAYFHQMPQPKDETP